MDPFLLLGQDLSKTFAPFLSGLTPKSAGLAGLQAASSYGGILAQMGQTTANADATSANDLASAIAAAGNARTAAGAEAFNRTSAAKAAAFNEQLAAGSDATNMRLSGLIASANDHLASLDAGTNAGQALVDGVGRQAGLRGQLASALGARQAAAASSGVDAGQGIVADNAAQIGQSAATAGGVDRENVALVQRRLMLQQVLSALAGETEKDVSGQQANAREANANLSAKALTDNADLTAQAILQSGEMTARNAATNGMLGAMMTQANAEQLRKAQQQSGFAGILGNVAKILLSGPLRR